MEAKVQGKLGNLIERFGLDLLDDQKRFEAILKDTCNSNKLEVTVLIAALRDGAPDELRNHQTSKSAEPLIRKLALRLQQNQGLEESAARWAVETWALVLRAVTAADLEFCFECPACQLPSRYPTWISGSVVTCPSCRSTIKTVADRSSVSLVSRAAVSAASSAGSSASATTNKIHGGTYSSPSTGTTTTLPVSPTLASHRPRFSGAGHKLLGGGVIAGLLVVSFFAYNGSRNNGAESSGTTLPSGAQINMTPPSRPSVENTVAQPPVKQAEAIKPRTLGSLLDEVSSKNTGQIEKLLGVATNGSKEQIEAAARAVGREYNFASVAVSRDRKLARLKNEKAISAFNEDKNYQAAYDLQIEAFLADPLDVEVAGNLGIYAFRLGKIDEAFRIATYALSLPRGPERTGRTADWNTLAAAYAAKGDADRARSALYVTLALANDIGKRCYSAVYSVKNTYGDALRIPTEEMFERIRALGNGDIEECRLPIKW